MALAASAAVAAMPARTAKLNLRMTPAVAAGRVATESGSHPRSRYMLPETRLPGQDNDGIRFRWKLNKVKMTMPLPSI